MGLEHPYRRHHGHDVRNTNQHLDTHHMLINGRQRTFVPSSTFSASFRYDCADYKTWLEATAKGITTLCVLNPVSVRSQLARRKNTWQKQSKCVTGKEGKK
jgi:IS5 family transposase